MGLYDTGRTGHDLDFFEDLFNVGIPFEGKIDVAYFIKIPNADIARRALRFLSDQNNEFELRARHSEDDLHRLWRGTFRGCIAHGVEIPADLKGFCKRLGVVVP
jgi:hypothetical protein